MCDVRHNHNACATYSTFTIQVWRHEWDNIHNTCVTYGTCCIATTAREDKNNPHSCVMNPASRVRIMYGDCFVLPTYNAAFLLYLITMQNQEPFALMFHHCKAEIRNQELTRLLAEEGDKRAQAEVSNLIHVVWKSRHMHIRTRQWDHITTAVNQEGACRSVT